MLVCCGFSSTGGKLWNANSGTHCITWPLVATVGPGGGPRHFFDYEIVLVYLWASIHDRPVSWACNPTSWPDDLRPSAIPSQSTMSRRLRTTEVLRLMQAIEERVAPVDRSCWVRVIDGKPLAVGTYSKDPDARWGNAGQGSAKGYKLRALYGRQATPDVWEVAPLNVSEPEVGAHLIRRLKGAGYVLGDKAFDSNPVHQAANDVGAQLVAERKRPKTNLGHRPHTAGRLRSMSLLQTDFGRTLYRYRTTIERSFGHLTNHAAGLAPLPNWVRRISRVRLWVQAKLIIHATYVRVANRSPPIAHA